MTTQLVAVNAKEARGLLQSWLGADEHLRLWDDFYSLDWARVAKLRRNGPHGEIRYSNEGVWHPCSAYMSGRDIILPQRLHGARIARNVRGDVSAVKEATQVAKREASIPTAA